MSYDGDVHETRRNVLLAAGVTVAAVAVLAVLFWFIGSLQGPKLTAGTPAAATTSTAPPTAAGTPSAAPSETTTGPPTIETWTPTTTFSLPPPDAPVAQDPGTPDAPVTSNTPPPAPAPQPTQTQPPAPTRAPQTQQPPAPSPSTNDAAPSISNVNLACSQDNGRKVTATLSFTTTTRVAVTLSAGGDSQRGQAGPGDVSLSASGRGTPLCFARVGNQIVGPVPAT